MLFSSPVFLFSFLPLVYLINMKLPIKYSNGFLTAVSLLFYAWGEPVYILLLIASLTMNYLATVLMMRWHKKQIFILCILMNLGLLAVFKYAGFFVGSVNAVTGLSLGIPEIRLPLGISFFTFQVMSYVIDVYAGKVALQKSFLKLMLYISFFPQLIAGPIVKYKEIELRLSERQITTAATAAGIKRFIGGLSKKLLIANTFALAADQVFAMQPDKLNIFLAWIGAISYVIQIYFDFSGYSDMAIGLGKMFGFDFPENFNYPYISASIHEFWKRWHISLSSWFREYLYFPLGGNRKSKFRTALNRTIVFFFTGLWHGANYTFILWGLFHGLFLTLETMGVIRLNKGRLKPLGHVYTLLVVTVGFVILRADTLAQAAMLVINMFAGFTFNEGTKIAVGLIVSPLLIFCIIPAVVFSAPVVRIISQRLDRSSLKPAAGFVSGAVSLGLYFLCILNLSTSSYNPFIYFRF